MEVRAADWARDPDGVLGKLEAFAAGTGDPRLMVKPARLGTLGGHDARARARGARGPRSSSRSATTTSRSPSGTSPARATSRSRCWATSPREIELYGPGEIKAGHEFYDYEAKYVTGLSETTPTAEVTPVQRATILKLARDAYRAIGAEGFARVDFLLSGDTLLVSEINTIPGFTPISLFPVLCAAGGYDFAGVCRRVVDLALERDRRRVRHRLTAADLPR